MAVLFELSDKLLLEVLKYVLLPLSVSSRKVKRVCKRFQRLMSFLPQEHVSARLLKALADAANAPGRKIGLHDVVYQKLKGAIVGMSTAVSNSRLHGPSLDIPGKTVTSTQRESIKMLVDRSEVTLKNHVAGRGGDNHLGIGRDLDRNTCWRVADAVLRLPDKPAPAKVAESVDLPEGVEFPGAEKDEEEELDEEQPEGALFSQPIVRTITFTHALEDLTGMSTTSRLWASCSTRGLARLLFGEDAEAKKAQLIYDQIGSGARFKLHKRFHMNFGKALGSGIEWSNHCTYYFISLLTTQSARQLYNVDVFDTELGGAKQQQQRRVRRRDSLERQRVSPPRRDRPRDEPDRGRRGEPERSRRDEPERGRKAEGLVREVRADRVEGAAGPEGDSVVDAILGPADSPRRRSRDRDDDRDRDRRREPDRQRGDRDDRDRRDRDRDRDRDRARDRDRERERERDRERERREREIVMEQERQQEKERRLPEREYFPGERAVSEDPHIQENYIVRNKLAVPRHMTARELLEKCVPMPDLYLAVELMWLLQSVDDTPMKERLWEAVHRVHARVSGQKDTPMALGAPDPKRKREESEERGRGDYSRREEPRRIEAPRNMVPRPVFSDRREREPEKDRDKDRSRVREREPARLPPPKRPSRPRDDGRGRYSSHAAPRAIEDRKRVEERRREEEREPERRRSSRPRKEERKRRSRDPDPKTETREQLDKRYRGYEDQLKQEYEAARGKRDESPGREPRSRSERAQEYESRLRELARTYAREVEKRESRPRKEEGGGRSREDPLKAYPRDDGKASRGKEEGRDALKPYPSSRAHSPPPAPKEEKEGRLKPLRDSYTASVDLPRSKDRPDPRREALESARRRIPSPAKVEWAPRAREEITLPVKGRDRTASALDDLTLVEVPPRTSRDPAPAPSPITQEVDLPPGTWTRRREEPPAWPDSPHLSPARPTRSSATKPAPLPAYQQPGDPVKPRWPSPSADPVRPSRKEEPKKAYRGVVDLDMSALAPRVKRDKAVDRAAAAASRVEVPKPKSGSRKTAEAAVKAARHDHRADGRRGGGKVRESPKPTPIEVSSDLESMQGSDYTESRSATEDEASSYTDTASGGSVSGSSTVSSREYRKAARRR